MLDIAIERTPTVTEEDRETLTRAIETGRRTIDEIGIHKTGHMLLTGLQHLCIAAAVEMASLLISHHQCPMIEEDRDGAIFPNQADLRHPEAHLHPPTEEKIASETVTAVLHQRESFESVRETEVRHRREICDRATQTESGI